MVSVTFLFITIYENGFLFFFITIQHGKSHSELLGPYENERRQDLALWAVVCRHLLSSKTFPQTQSLPFQLLSWSGPGPGLVLSVLERPPFLSCATAFRLLFGFQFLLLALPDSHSTKSGQMIF